MMSSLESIIDTLFAEPVSSYPIGPVSKSAIVPFVDFFSAGFLANSLAELSAFVEFLAKSARTSFFKYRFPMFRGKRYEHCWSEPDALFLVHGTPLTDSGITFDCRLELKGSYWRSFFGYSEQLDFLQQLAKLRNFNPTRIDCSLDDYDRRFSYSEVKFLAENALYGPSESFHYHKSGGMGDSKFGESISFGARSSDKRLIFYDSDYVHNIPADRWELTYKKHFAQSATRSLLSGEYNPAQLLLGSFSLFEQEWGNIHPLWHDMRLEAQKIFKVQASVAPTSFEEKLAHVRDKYAANFALFQDCLGEYQFADFMQRLIDYGHKTQSRKHRACIAKYKIQSEGKSFDLNTFFATQIETENTILEA